MMEMENETKTGHETGHVAQSDPNLDLPSAAEVVSAGGPALTRLGDRMYDVTYVCANPKCGARQTLRFFPDEPPFAAIGCSDCMPCSGRGVASVQQLIASGRAMFPVMEQAAVGGVS